MINIAINKAGSNKLKTTRIDVKKAASNKLKTTRIDLKKAFDSVEHS